MSFLDPTLVDAQEPTAVPADEYKIRLLAVAEGTDKHGHAYIMPRFEIPDNPLAKDFTHFLHIPDDDWMDEKKLNASRWGMLSFMQAMGIDPTIAVEWEELGGEEGWAVLGLSDNEEYGEQNHIRKYVVPA